MTGTASVLAREGAGGRLNIWEGAGAGGGRCGHGLCRRSGGAAVGHG